MKKQLITGLALSSLLATGAVSAADMNAKQMEQGYKNTAEQASKKAEAKCGEGKCGGDKKAEAKCGEGKCGGDKK